MAYQALPVPGLVRKDSLGTAFFTDDSLYEACGVRIAFTTRIGGFSGGCYGGLNLGFHVEDARDAVEANRRLLLRALGATSDVRVVSPNQVHGVDVCVLGGEGFGIEGEGAFGCDASGTEVEGVFSDVDEFASAAAEGADALVVDSSDVAALLCYADCMPVIMVAPNGAFAVCHAGWRGAYGEVCKQAHEALCSLDPGLRASEVNAYIGPFIHSECFEVSADLCCKFVDCFGSDVAADKRHVDLGAVVRATFAGLGYDPARIADVGMCTVCNNDLFFSYRSQDGKCGRHGAIAFRDR